MEGNLTKGPILRTLTKLAIPIMASSFLGTLYNITDMAWIGLLGSKAVAGVGVGGMFTWFSQGLAAMARMGGQVQVAQCIGRGEKEKAHGFAQAAVQLAAFMGMAYALLSLVFTKQMVGFFQLADAEAHAAAMSYTKIACGLIVFSFMTLTLTQAFIQLRVIQNTVSGESDWTCDEYDPGSGPDSRTRTISEAWGDRCSDCNGDSAGNCYEYYGPCSYRAEERKCIKRNSAFCRNSTRIFGWNL